MHNYLSQNVSQQIIIQLQHIRLLELLATTKFQLFALHSSAQLLWILCIAGDPSTDLTRKAGTILSNTVRIIPLVDPSGLLIPRYVPTIPFPPNPNLEPLEWHDERFGKWSV